MLFTKEFLDELSENIGATVMLNEYIDNKKMSFHDAVLKIANHYGMTPVYCPKGYSRPLSDEARKILYSIYDKNEEALRK